METRYQRLMTLLDSYFGPHTNMVLTSIGIFLTATIFALLCCIVEMTKH